VKGADTRSTATSASWGGGDDLAVCGGHVGRDALDVQPRAAAVRSSAPQARASSRNIRADATVVVAGETVDVPLSMNSTIGELLAHPKAGPLLRDAFGGRFDEGLLRVLGPHPVGRMEGFPLPRADMENLIAQASA
jgi:hypothetical protein